MRNNQQPTFFGEALDAKTKPAFSKKEVYFFIHQMLKNSLSLDANEWFIQAVSQQKGAFADFAKEAIREYTQGNLFEKEGDNTVFMYLRRMFMDISLSKLKQLNAPLWNPDSTKTEERKVLEGCGEMVKNDFWEREFYVETEGFPKFVELFLRPAKHWQRSQV